MKRKNSFLKQLRRVSFFTVFILFVALLSVFVAIFSGSGDSSKSSDGDGQQTTLTAAEVAAKGGLSVERAQDVIAILNHLMSKENSTLEGASGFLAIAERESNFDPKAINNGGGVAGYFQWSGWSSKVNGDRWANAPERKLDSKTELDLLSKELNGSYGNVKTYIQTAKDSGKAALYISEHYEGVSLSDGQTKADELQKDAEKWKNIFKGTLKGSESPGGAPGGSGTVAASYDFPSEYRGKLKYGEPTSNVLTTLGGNTYPAGQCTWYVTNRLIETGITTDAAVYNYNGNGQDWVNSLVTKGWKKSDKPEVGAVCSTAGGADGTMAAYGHVAFVECVNSDGTFLISECNYAGVQNKVHYRVCSPASYYTFATRK
ncbi:phage tail-type lysozyme domain-containing protein [Streptococcus mutans]|nr:phage tail-type lysozyme domain-containing protein [Streptococcus mutans]MCB5122555.1 phage tail-type lysozyme domain-containing protein [Streptococcus mutans]